MGWDPDNMLSVSEDALGSSGEVGDSCCRACPAERPGTHVVPAWGSPPALVLLPCFVMLFLNHVMLFLNHGLRQAGENRCSHLKALGV